MGGWGNKYRVLSCRIAGRYHDWVQDVLIVAVAMFHKMGLNANLEKTKAVVCTPKFI